MSPVTEGVLGIIAGTIEKLLQEEHEGIAKSFGDIPEGIKVTIGVELDRSDEGVEVNYTLSYPLEPKAEATIKQKIKKKEIINENQAQMDLES